MSANLTGHLDPNDPSLSPLTRSLLGLRDTVMATWIESVNRQIPKAEGLLHPVIENTLPGFFDSLAALFSEQHVLRIQTDLGVLATEHGGERARLTQYDTIAIIHELQLFRDVLFTEAGKAGIELSHDQRLLVHAHIDSAVRESVNSFVAVQAALREQFVAAITHDLRTPLANAQMAAQLIERSAAEPEIRRLAGQVIENTRRIDGMTRELLNKIVFSADSDSSLQLSEFDLAELAHEVTRYAQGAHPIELRVQVQPLRVHWCRESIQRALENLVSNATKYGEPEPPIMLDVTTDGARAQLSVHNRGTPIPPEDQESIFQLYRRAASGNGHQEGWGVGLPFVRKVAESHGGSIMVASSAADGTTFVMDMPIDARPFQQAPTAA